MAHRINLDIANQLEALGVSLSGPTKDIRDGYKARAYFTAAEAIRKHPDRICSGAQAQRDIRGVGKTTAERIDRYLVSGSVMLPSRRESLIPDIERAGVIQTFEAIHGVGPETAAKWYDQGFRTLDSLSRIYLKMTSAQQIGYRYYSDLQQRIPRSESDKFNELFTEIIRHRKFMICGSYRRGNRTSGDIDLLVRGSNFKDDNERILGEVVGKLVRRGVIIETLEHGPSKFMGLCKLTPTHYARRLDILVTRPESWAAATLYFTGSKGLNILMRKRAKEFGWNLNEYGLWKPAEWVPSYISDEVDVRVPASIEEDIFDHLGVEYMEPGERNI